MTDFSIGTLLVSSGENLIKQIPIMGLISNTLDGYQKQKLRYFLDEIEKGTKDIYIDEIHNNDILQNFYLTFKAVAKARKQERIKNYSELYCNYLKENNCNYLNHDNYELILNLLTNLTEIELSLLLILNKYEKPFRVVIKEKPHQKISDSSYWKAFIDEARSVIKIDTEFINNLFTILEAKGMFSRAQNHGFYTNQNGYGILTPVFINILTYLPSIKS